VVWILLLLTLSLTAVLGVSAWRRHETRILAAGIAERQHAQVRGTARARLQHPVIDLTQCIGCATCVAACPEDGVLGMLHGQAAVFHGARCVGHGRCAEACPVGAIALTLGDLSERRDIPVLGPHNEAAGVPGLFLAGEITGYALIRTAIEHGRVVASEVARRITAQGPDAHAEVFDLCIVGAGPAGLSCALEAKRRGLRFIVLEQERTGGTVTKYPRRKLVMTSPVDLPIVGRMERSEYSKEELLELWERIAREQELPIRIGEELREVKPREDGRFEVFTGGTRILARNVCLALGRRGTPVRLGVPGEDRSKVSYGLLDAQSYTNRRILVVGGGDSAVEAAIGLAEQPGNQVVLSYRQPNFSRIKARNEKRLAEASTKSSLNVRTSTRVHRIEEEFIELNGAEGAESITLPNDEVFILAGGKPPFDLLQAAGVSFDHSAHPGAPAAAARATGLLPALLAGLVVTLAALAWVAFYRGYYGAAGPQRALDPLHDLLRSSRGFGLAAGIAATSLLALNLTYLLRRAPGSPLQAGSLRHWMTAHVASGILALVAALLHGGFDARNTVGGHALWGMAVLVATGALGRYFYSFVPRAANGRELEIDELRGDLGRISAEWDRGQAGFGARVRGEVERLIEDARWRSSLWARAGGLLRSQRSLRRALKELREEGRREDVAPADLDAMLELARRAHRAALMSARYEDVRGLLATWRWLHRWIALLVVLLLVVHVVSALRFSSLA
jgi:thioredoxin reductase